MRIIERVDTHPDRRLPAYRVQCEGCGEVYCISDWAHNITEQRRCHACSPSGWEVRRRKAAERAKIERVIPYPVGARG